MWVTNLSMIQHGSRLRKPIWAEAGENFVESEGPFSYIDMLMAWRIAGAATLLFVTTNTGVPDL